MFNLRIRVKQEEHCSCHAYLQVVFACDFQLILFLNNRDTDLSQSIEPGKQIIEDLHQFLRRTSRSEGSEPTDVCEDNAEEKTSSVRHESCY